MRVGVLSRPADDGFTLVELLVAVTIMGLVLAAVAGVTFVTVGSAADADTRLRESNDLSRVATYFGDDVQAAQTVAVGTTPRCGTDPRAVVELAGEDFADTAPTITTTVVTYVLRAGVGGTELHRLACASTGGTPTYPLTPVRDVPVVLLSGTMPAVTCGGGTCGPSFTGVELTVAERSGGLTYRLTGRRRTT